MESMKLKIGDYEIEVKARRSFGAPDVEYNRQDTGYFLNEIATAYRVASGVYSEADLPALASDFLDKFMEIYRALDKAGFYDDI